MTLILIVVLIIHLPPVQKTLATKVSGYLSDMVQSEVTIKRIQLSIWDGIAIWGLEIKDPEGNVLLTSNRIGATPDLTNLIFGNFVIQYLNLQEVDVKLIQTAQGLNIQFIIDSFQPERTPPVSDEESNFSLRIGRVNFEDIHFQYISEPDGSDLDFKLGTLNTDLFELSTTPNKVKIEQVSLNNVDVNMLSTVKSESAEPMSLPPLDFGSGFEFQVNQIELKDHNIAYHFGKISQTEKFDPDHLVLKNTQLKLADILVRQDSLAFSLQQFSTDLPGFTLADLRGTANAGPNKFNISDLELLTGKSNCILNLSANYDSWSNLLEEVELAELNLNTKADIQQNDFSYFLVDSVLNAIKNWPHAQLELQGSYSNEKTNIDVLRLTAGKSLLTAEVKAGKITKWDSIYWDLLSIHASIGPAFKSLIIPYVEDQTMPEALEIQLLSSGNPGGFDLNTRLTSNLGAISIQGNAGLKDQTIELNTLTVGGEKLNLSKLLDIAWLGTTDFSLQLLGKMGRVNDLQLTGLIEQIEINSNQVRNLAIEGSYKQDNVLVHIDITDPDFTSNIQSAITINEPLVANMNLNFDGFGLGKLLLLDSSLVVTANFNSGISIDKSNMRAELNGQCISFSSDFTDYAIDSLALAFTNSSSMSSLSYYTENVRADMEANFDIKEAPALLGDLMDNLNDSLNATDYVNRNRNFSFDIEMTTDEPLKLLNRQLKEFSGIYLSGQFTESNQKLEVTARSSRFDGFGASLDSMYTKIDLSQEEIDANLFINNIFYDSLQVGDLRFRIAGNHSDINSSFEVRQDSLVVLGIESRSQNRTDGIYTFVDSLISFNRNLTTDPSNPVVFRNWNVFFDRFRVNGEKMEIMANGDTQEFELTVKDADLTGLNHLIASDRTLVYSGNLNGLFAFVKADKKINLQTEIDNLTFKDTPPMKIRARAVSEADRIPLQFSLSSATNNINLSGNYYDHTSEIDASLSLDLSDMSTFEFLYAKYLKKLSGSITGQIDIAGTIQKPDYQGKLGFEQVDFTVLKTGASFHLNDETVSLDDSGIGFNGFTIYDQWQNPLEINGSISTSDYRSFEYDLSVDTDNYLLINNPYNKDYQVQGKLVIGSNLKLKGNQNDTNVEADIAIKDSTALTYVMPQENLELVTNEGIVEFIDPEHPADTLADSQIKSMYDSLMSTLPSFNLTSSIKLEDKARFKLVVDANSGDFIEASGNADLTFKLDRTKNAELVGICSITDGFYQLFFYDLVKKRFDLTTGSTISWTGNPNNGDLDIRAVNVIKTSSIGLIGHEVGENEKALYRKALPYEIGIIITGTLESPQVSFSLDLPEDEKANYPALSNKLTRLKQPEFESELNKQVFGLLVLGGFIPESGASEFNENLIATTALTNSVNSILASQLNRFASHLIKGVDINVGLQSYSDYSSGSGQTRTAMDFRVSKRLIDDRLSIEVGGGMDINTDQSGAYAGNDNFRGDITVIYDLTESGNKQIKLFNNETYDIVYHEIRNTGVSLIFIKEFDKRENQTVP